MLLGLGISLYIVGLLVFYTWGQFSTGWYEYYYIWDKAKDLLLVWALYSVVSNRLKWAVLPVLTFSFVRLLWQIISTLTGWDINNVKAAGFLFIGLALVCSFLFLKEFWKWHLSNGRGF